MNPSRNFFALAAALLMPVVIDGALMPKASQAIPEALLAQAKTSDGKSLAIEDIERLAKEVKQAKEAGNYQKAIDILGQVLAIEKRS